MDNWKGSHHVDLVTLESWLEFFIKSIVCIFSTFEKNVWKLQEFAKYINYYAAGGLFGQYKMMQKIWKVIETLAHEYSSESTQEELCSEYQHDRFNGSQNN